MQKYRLSKSAFIRSVQCQKHLFLYKNYFRLKDPVSKDKQAIFNRGTNVGILAQQLFPGGIDVSPDNIRKYDEAAELTKQLITEGKEVIYEAAFIFEGVLAALDILVKRNNKWYAYEVKSSAKISAAYVLDASLQYYVIKNCLPELEDFFLVTINTEYVLGKEPDLHKLFKFTSVKKDVMANLPYIENRLAEAMKTIANDDMPAISIGEHCFRPYKCDYFGTCWKHLPENNIFQLNAAQLPQQIEWYKKGQKLISTIEESEELSRNLKIQISGIKTNSEYIEKEKLVEFINKTHYPAGFFDIEQFSPAVPVFEGTKPYQQIPFLFSLHILEENGTLHEDHFFAEAGADPRKEFLLACIDKLSKVKSILVFDANLENSILGVLGNEFPEYKKQLQEIQSRIIDVSIPFSRYWYFHPKALGSTSLKHLYRKHFEDNKFEEMHVNSGATANYAYIELFNEQDIFKKEEVKQQLIDYCRMDTLATVKLFLLLNEKAA